MVVGDWRDTTQVVDAAVDDLAGRCEIRWHLDGDFLWKPGASHRHDPPQCVDARRAVLPAFVFRDRLDDDLLNVSVAFVEFADGQQALGAVVPILADADQNPGRERDAEFAGVAQRVEALAGTLRAWPAVGLHLGGGFEHHAHRGVQVGDLRHLLAGLVARIRVGQQSLVQRNLTALSEVGVNRVVAPLVELVVNLGVAVVWVVTEGEQRFRTARVRAGADDLTNVVRRHERRLAGDVVVRAVRAGVPASGRQRDEDVATEGEFGCGVDIGRAHVEQSLDGMRVDGNLNIVLLGPGKHIHVSEGDCNKPTARLTERAATQP